MRAEPAAVEQLAFEGGEEALAHGVVVAIPDRSGGRAHAGVAAALAEGDRGVLRSLVGMVDHAVGPALPEGHVEGIEHEPCAQVVGHGPADHAAAEGIQHDGEEEEPGPGGDVGDVGAPKPIGCVGGEGALDQVRRRAGARIPRRRSRPLASADAPQARTAHQSGDPLAAHSAASIDEIGVDAGSTIGASRNAMNLADAIEQRPIALGAGRRRPDLPRVAPAGGDPRQPAHRGDGIHGPVGSHELENPDGIEPVSRTNQAAAFASISRSWRRRRFSRLSRRSSSRAALVRPSCERPSSRSAGLNQLRSDWADGSNSRNSSSGQPPELTRSTICSRNSDG